jgi:exosortase B
MASPPQAADVKPWLIALTGFLALYLPIYWQAMGSSWQREEHAHGPIILAIAAWLTWQDRSRWLAQPPSGGKRAEAWALLLLGLLAYVLGRALKFSILEFGAQPVIAIAAIVLTSGWAAARALWFPIFFLIFMIPLPGSFVDAATGALKQWVSLAAEWLLATAHYPVGRSGVTLTVGNYQLLVADACSGLHSMFTLTAMGMLLLYLRARKNLAHQLIMLASILPIAFVANTIRVMILVLVTYHLGDEAGQGFLHGAAGIVVIVAALLFFIALDGLLAWALAPRTAKRG